MRKCGIQRQQGSRSWIQCGEQMVEGSGAQGALALLPTSHGWCGHVGWAAHWMSATGKG